MQIRKIVSADLPQLLELAREVREHHREVLNGYFTPQDDNMEARCIAAWMENDDNVCLCAEESGKVLGMILGESKNNSWLEKSKVIVIHNFGVVASARGQGVGKKLMDAFYLQCKNKGIQEIKFGVFNKNKTAYDFYIHYGFEPQEQKMSMIWN